MRVVCRCLVVAVVLMRGAFGQCRVPTDSIYIPETDVKELRKHAPPAVDQQLRVVDLCKYNLAVGIIHRGPTGAAARGRGKGGKRAANPETCSSGPAPANGTPTGIAGISHDDETETYIIVSGGGTLVTGGAIVNGSRSGAESEVTKSGQIIGEVTKRVVALGDIIITPYGILHGWTGITDHVDYLSVRPDPDHVLQPGYVNPAISK